MADKFYNRPLVYGLLALLCALTVYWVAGTNTSGPPPETGSFEPIAVPDDHHTQKQTEVHLYFADRENAFLNSERKLLLKAKDPAQYAKQIVQALIEGPTHGLIRMLPEKTVLNALYIAENQTAYVDFSEEIAEIHSGGCQTELLTVYSLVNSLILNLSGIEKVKILIGGKEADTLAGHIDLHHPFRADMLLVR